MKSRFLILFVLIINIVFSQEELPKRSFVGGIRAGIVGSQVDGDSYGGYNKPGLVAGFVINRRLNDSWSFQMEMVYIQKGALKNADPENGDYTMYLMSLHYAQIPLLFKYKIKSNKFTFVAGLTIAALFKSVEENLYGPISYTTPYPFKKTEIGYSVGFAYPLTKRIEADARFSYSITSIRPAYTGYSVHLLRGQFNHLIELSVAYKFMKQ